jgi:hypothetical protein
MSQPIKTCPRCLGRGQVIANAHTGLLAPCPARHCTARAALPAAPAINGHAKEDKKP